MEDLQPITFEGIDPERPLVIAGPCSAETEEQVLCTASELAANGIKIFRAGIWKPRTKPGGFEGVGAPGLEWLKKVKETTGMYTATEVATRQHVNDALAAGVDILWIGARTSANPFAMQEIADTIKESGRTDITVLVKNPVNPDIELWIGAMQRIYNAGIRRLGAIHRGFSTYGKHLYRNMPQWHIPTELRLRFPSLPIIVDPSHIGGKRELIAPLSQQALHMAFNALVVRDSRQSTENLTLLRQQIDQIDNDLLETLSKRMRVSREIGQYKKEHRMPVVQAGRYNDVIRTRVKLGQEMGMDERFMRTSLSPSTTSRCDSR